MRVVIPSSSTPSLTFPRAIVVTGCAVSGDDLYFGEGYAGNLHRMRLPGPDEQIVGRFEAGSPTFAPDGALWVVTPNVLYRRAPRLSDEPHVTERDVADRDENPLETPSPSASPSPTGEEAGSATTAGLVVAGLLIGGLLLMRNRLLRR